MPNLNLGFCAVLCVTSAGAATCEPGYYLSNGTCQQCNPGYEAFYCPGDDVRHPCPTTDTDYSQFGYGVSSVGEASWASSPASGATDCKATFELYDEHDNRFIVEPNWNGTNYDFTGWWSNHYLWYAAGPGYYLSPYWSTTYRDWYLGTKPCTNAPAHAHYTGPGTPDEPKIGGQTDYNDCPWACDDGYGRVGDTCEPLCATGITHLHAGTTTVPLFPVKYTSPAIVVQTDGGVCYGNLTPGQGTGINITINGTTYHLE